MKTQKAFTIYHGDQSPREASPVEEANDVLRWDKRTVAAIWFWRRPRSLRAWSLSSSHKAGTPFSNGVSCLNLFLTDG